TPAEGIPELCQSMSVSTQLSQTINRIVEELSPEECKRLAYLCGALAIDRPASNIREMLQSLLGQVETEQVFLMELMLRMRRYDLLKCVLGTTKTEAEGLLRNGHCLSEYRVLMAELSEDVGSGDLESLVFLLRGTLPKEKLEKFECFLDIVVELERLDQISSSRMDVMEQYLRAIHRVDLAKKLSQYRSRAERPGQRSGLIKTNEDWQLRRAASPKASSGTPPTSCSTSQVLPRPCAERPGQRSGLIKTKEDWQLRRAASPKASSGTPPTSCSTSQVPPRPCASAAVLQRPPNEAHCERPEDVYRMQSEPRGMCVIIDCIGTEGVVLGQMFEGLHFRVNLHVLLSVQDMLSTLQSVSKLREHYEADAFICCIISRSCSSDLLGTDPRGPGLSLEYVRQLFTPGFCPGLGGKPKLFFIQSYEVSGPQRFGDYAGFWGYGSGELETDGPKPIPYRTEGVPADADVFWSHCWTKEQQLELVNHRSVYLQSLKEALEEAQRRKINLMDVHMEVNRAVYDHNHRNPQLSYQVDLRHTLRKNLYFS
ncbi:hypothetical protein NFI96_028875, partial [Prochilodus magdalenae]